MQAVEPITISESEWEIMRVVWANESVTSREVINVLGEKMGWKESTIKTLIGRLVDKEVLSTTKEGRKFIYRANLNESDTVRNYSEDILSRVCNKQNGLVLSHLIDEAELSKSDIETLIEKLQEKNETAPDVVPCQCAPGQCECHLI
ncbi:MAG TPA: CopY/TcrY family copper transport repressor [Atopostipes sp.]|nr:CopY/TcrY family copper transport repressor [Atopostipes sp.]